MGATHLSLRPGRARRALSAAVLTVAAFAAVAGALGVGARPASATTAPRATVVAGLALPLDQWLATGRVSSATGTNVVHAGDVLVRAWYFKKVCPAHGQCQGQFIRQLSGGGAQVANIVELAHLESASFPSTVVPCGGGAKPTQGTEHDSYAWHPVNGHLGLVHEESVFAGCGSARAEARVDWNAVSVPLAPSPKFAPVPTRSSTVAAFHQTLTRVCSDVNAELVPVTSQMSKDVIAIRAVGSNTGAAAGDAAASLAKLYPQLLPIAIKDYVVVPSPPAPLSQGWLRYGDLERQELPEVASELVALSNLYAALSRYERTRNLIDLQQAFAEQSLAGADQSATSGQHQTATALAKQLGVPATCTSPPALAAVGGYLLP